MNTHSQIIHPLVLCQGPLDALCSVIRIIFTVYCNSIMKWLNLCTPETKSPKCERMVPKVHRNQQAQPYLFIPCKFLTDCWATSTVVLSPAKATINPPNLTLSTPLQPFHGSKSTYIKREFKINFIQITINQILCQIIYVTNCKISIMVLFHLLLLSTLIQPYRAYPFNRNVQTNKTLDEPLYL